MPFFRRRLDPARAASLAAYSEVAGCVEAAQRALLAAVPTFRDDGVPLAIALADLSAHLREVEAAMAGWRDAADPERWDRCERGLQDARDEAERLRLEPGELVFEALNGRLGDVLFHLEVFGDVERELRERTDRAQGR